VPSFLFSVYHIINIDNSDKSNPSNARTSSITQASKTPKGINKGLFIIESLLSLEIIKKLERRTLLVLPRNSPIIVTNSQYNTTIYFNLYIHTIVYNRDYYIGSITPRKT